MVSYFISRIRVLIFSLLFASVVIFMMIEIIPGDPASFMLGINAQADTIEALKNELGLNVSKFQRYLNWATGMLGGDFGISYTYRVPVSELVLSRLGVSIPLAIYAIVLSTIIALPVGIISAAHHGTFKDWSIMGFTQLGIAIPNFWFAMLLVYLFAIILRWFSAGGFPGWETGIFSFKIGDHYDYDLSLINIGQPFLGIARSFILIQISFLFNFLFLCLCHFFKQIF